MRLGSTDSRPRVECQGGPVVDLDERMATSISHEVYAGTSRADGSQVIVKLEDEPGRLENEERALRWTAAHGAPVPPVVFYGAALADGAWRTCLVTVRVAGEPPRSVAAWRRMGAALARLATVPTQGSGLRASSEEEFVADHRHRVSAVREPLTSLPFGAELLEQLNRPAPPLGPLVLTHADPGPGNYLDTADGGVLLDWENAVIAPIGLDPARAAFIGLLELPHSGDPDHPEKAISALHGYAGAASWQPDGDSLHWWLGVAGITFVYNRWRNADRPRTLPWQHAAGVLHTVLTTRLLAGSQKPLLLATDGVTAVAD